MSAREFDGGSAVTEHEAVAEWDASYVLGALTPADRRRFEQHVETCLRCRTAVTDLSGLPGLLAGASIAEVEDGTAAAAPPPDLLPRLIAATRQRRARRRRTVVGVALAAVAAAVVAVVALWPGTAGTPGTVSLALQPVVTTPLSVQADLVPESWGTRLDLHCRFRDDGGPPGPDRDYSYRLFVTDRSGVTTAAGGWTYGPGTTAEPVGSSSRPVDQIEAVEVRGDDGTLLLRATR